MIHKIIQTGLLLSVLLMIPGVFKDAPDHPLWAMTLIIGLGIIGLVMAFCGMLVLIWI